jgi:hypothetical protein
MLAASPHCRSAAIDNGYTGKRVLPAIHDTNGRAKRDTTKKITQ